MSRSLSRLLRPNSIAIVGGGAWCENVIEQCKKSGFAGAIWPVHPARRQIGDLTAYADIAALPGPVDACFIGVNRHTTIEVVQALRQSGAGGAVCFAAGFAEAAAEDAGATSLQNQLLAAAGDMPILGPNCYGFINYFDGALLWPDQHGGKRQERGVAIVTQSSNIAINMTMQNRGLPIGYMVTAGNQAQQDLAEIGLALLDDPRTTALGLHIEGVGDVRALETLAAAARDARKPIVALKVGKSAAAQAATVSHTASLAGNDAGAEALLARIGISRTADIASFLEALKLAHVTGHLASSTIASASCSGGEASLIADMAEPLGLTFPPLDAQQSQDLRQALGPLVRLANPLDYNTYIWPNRDKMAATFAALMQSDLGLGVIVLDFPRADRCSDADWAHVVDAIEMAQNATGTPMAVLASLAENLPEYWAQDLIARGIAPLCGMAEGLAAIAAMARGAPDAQACLALPRVAHKTVVLDEDESKAILARAGLSLPKRMTAAGQDAAVATSAQIGFPLVLKALGMAHKSDSGGVVLGLENTAELAKAAAAMGADEFLVEEMIDDGIAELIIGVTNDPAHGLLLTLGAGGILTEVLADTAHLLLPTTPADIRNALKSLKIYRLLEGYRGKSAADIDAIVAAAQSLAELVLTHSPAIIEAEINPLIARANGATAVDALITLESET